MNLFTVDIDWAPEPVIADTLALFERYGVPCTLFTTHRSAALDTCSRELFEIGIHPNFNGLLNGQGGNAEQEIDRLLALYPEARGARSHSLTQSTLLLDLFQAKGMVYEVNHFLPYWNSIRPFKLWNGMWRIPYNWEDDVHCAYGRTFDETGLDSSAALNVFDFHPVHVYLNTDTLSCYQRARAHYQDADRLLGLRNADRLGARTLLIRLLERESEGMTLTSLVELQPLLA
jgi:hypothetical protein